MPKSAPKSPVSPEDEYKLLAEFKERQFKTWPDLELPALGGRTPRDVARDPEGRARLVELLKTVENNEEHERIEGRPWFDVSKLKAELGVD